MTWGVSPVAAEPPPTGDSFPTFIQIQNSGVDLGDATAETLDFTGGLTATRGTGPDANKITVRGSSTGAATVLQLLEADYTLTQNDNNKIFYCTVPIIITIDNMTTPPFCGFAPDPDSGSITLHPINGVTIDGDTLDVSFNGLVQRMLNPVPSQSNAYILTQDPATFASLGGHALDNQDLAAQLSSKVNRAVPAPIKLVSNQTLQLDSSDQFRLFYSQANSARTVFIPAGLPLDTEGYLAVISPGTSTVRLGALTGVHILTPNPIVSKPGHFYRFRCNGTQDTYYLEEVKDGPLQITGSRAFTDADDGQTYEVTTTATLTLPAGLSWREGVALQLPTSGATVTIASDGTTTMNGSTTSQTRNTSTQRMAAILPRTAVDTYDVI